MSIYRKAFLVWRTAMLTFIAVITFLNRDTLPSLATWLTIVTICFGSWIPWSLRWRQRDQSCS